MSLRPKSLACSVALSGCDTAGNGSSIRFIHLVGNYVEPRPFCASGGDDYSRERRRACAVTLLCRDVVFVCSCESS